MASKRRRILILDGHPDGGGRRFIHALAEAYAQGAQEAGHDVRTLVIGQLDIPLLRKGEDFQTGTPSREVQRWQAAIGWSEHLVVLYPLWLGDMPAVLKAFFEQVLRPGFAFAASGKNRLPKKLLKGRSARVIVTMGMPALFYRWYYRAHSLKNLERNILAFSGFGPIRSTVIGTVEGKADTRAAWLEKARRLGRKAA